MKCPNCGAAELVLDTRDRPYTYRGETITIAAVTGEYCPICDEVVLDNKASEQYTTQAMALNKRVNANIVDPAFIVHVRKKLGLDQRQAGEYFGGGVNAFSRYETGKALPPLSLIKLLKVLDKHPDLLPEVAA
jgi:HTH-type transcriptional regulator / antitoxin MqsA